MGFNEQQILDDRDDRPKYFDNNKPNAWRVDDEDNLTEENLENSFLTGGGDDIKQVREGAPAGGNNFGKNNVTPAANDKNNPSRHAGSTNAYLSLTEPLDEHPENSNFKPAEQSGKPNYSAARATSVVTNSDPKPENPEERGNGENDRPHEEESYQEGTNDNDGPNIPGPNELPDQQKVGENLDEDKLRQHIEP